MFECVFNSAEREKKYERLFIEIYFDEIHCILSRGLKEHDRTQKNIKEL